MGDDFSFLSETKHGSKKAGRAGVGRSSAYRRLECLWHLIPNVSFRSRPGLIILGAATLIGAATSLGAIAMAGAPDSRSLAAYVFSLCSGAFVAASSVEAPFLAENQAAMTTMMAGMAIKPSGDVDRDFVAMMVPHHQGAIDMAQAELRYGRNELLRRIAQEIIVEQGQEIAAMHLALGQARPPSLPSPDQVAPHNIPLASPPTSNPRRSPE